MTVKDKVWRYISGHKRPVTVQQLVDYYLHSKSAIREALHELQAQGKLEVIKYGREPYGWRVKRMAVSAVAAPPPVRRSATYDRPIQNSYPNTRGYAD